MKTEKEIEIKIYKILKNSKIASSISGQIYRSDMRPTNSNKEDVVIKFLTGRADQLQTGIIVINIYVPDISVLNYSEKKEDSARIGEIQQLIYETIEELPENEFLFTLDTTPHTLQCEEIEQHYIYTRLAYNVIEK